MTLASDFASTAPLARSPFRHRARRVRDRWPATSRSKPRRQAGDEAELGFNVTRDGRPVAASPTSAPADIWSRCARATWPSCTCIRDADRAARSWRSSPRPGATACSCSSRPKARVHTAAFTQEVGTMSATTDHLELPITGMTCASCANRIERKLNKLDGVKATRQLRHREGDRRVRSGRGGPRAARGSRRGRRLRRRAAVAEAPAGEQAQDDATVALRRRMLVAAAAVGARAADVDDPGAPVRQLPVAVAATWSRPWCSGRPGRFTRRPGRTSSTAPRRWTR